jgi:aminoglycoside-2''-adenylyltransferase
VTGSPREPNAGQLAALASLDALLTDAHVDYWVFGGWAVDLHAGRITRDHHDLDLVVHVDDLDRVIELLHDRAWENAGGSRAEGYLAFVNDDVRLELAFIARDEDGTIYTPLPDGRASWPTGALGDDVGRVAGVRARMITLDALVAEKSTDHGDPTAEAKDRADLTIMETLRPKRGA